LKHSADSPRTPPGVENAKKGNFDAGTAAPIISDVGSPLSRPSTVAGGTPDVTGGASPAVAQSARF
jgi:hypothetical protein